MKYWIAIVFIAGSINVTQAQQTNDTIPLQEVIIHAFEQKSKLLQIPAAINYINTNQVNRYNFSSLVPALNNLPGVRMEERSPGSYRLNIRGSSLRSPFGVRNVKIYYNYIPLTSPGGTTFLNQLGVYNFQEVEIIKGPGSSLYGTGTGGVMLINSFPVREENQITLDATAGSYGYYSLHAAVQTKKNGLQNFLQFHHQASEGYRDHSALRRDVLNWDVRYKTNKNQLLSGYILLGDLYYQTPGGITAAAFKNNPRSARLKAGTVPGASESKAAIYEKTIIGGTGFSQPLNEKWQNNTSIYGAITFLKNPNIRNFEQSNNPHFGGRTVFQFQQVKGSSTLTWHNGAEFQKGSSAIKSYTNVNGNAGTLLLNDDINNQQAFIFSQLNIKYQYWLITAGLSLNQYSTIIKRLSSNPVINQKRNFNYQLAPRVAILRNINEFITLYGAVARGFSPPTTGELLPSGGAINTVLEPEYGINYETGLKATNKNRRFYFDVNSFYFRLNNTIVQRRDSAGGDSFINAGSTNQFGIEALLNYSILQKSTGNLKTVAINTTYTWHQFHYKQFIQFTNDFSGNRLPGIAPHAFTTSIDIFFTKGWYLLLNTLYNSKTPLNDANSAFADNYLLAGAKAGKKFNFKKAVVLNFYIGADNILNEKYSLGNDINAFGGRYFNAAPSRNYYAGIHFSTGK